jgi:flagellar export protein FliJ
MAFQFSLDAVLRHRITIEEREEATLQKIVFEIAQILDDLDRIQERLLECDAARRVALLKPSIGLDFHASYGELNALKHRRKELEERVRNLEQARDEQASVYKTARQNREVISSMHDKQRDNYELSLTKREQRTLDDNYLARRSR